MDKMNHGKGAATSIDVRPFLRIVGSVLGLLVGGVLLAWLLLALYGPSSNGDPYDMGAWGDFIIFGGLGLLIGGAIGAAVGATVVQKLLRQRSSFWKALLGAAIGLLVGGFFVVTVYGAPVALVLIIAGAVIGSGWKGKPDPSSSGMQGVVSPSDIMKTQPAQARCPFCQNTAFLVVEEGGSRRCSECHSVLPTYIKGNG